MDQGKKDRILRTLKIFWHKVKEYTRIKEDTDYEATVDFISQSVVFRGFNVWILFFAIIVASVGLNVNSTAVIIGAMLISPLMGPINGIGLAIGIFDEKLLQKSVKNLIIMVLISLAASTLYFLISPINDARSELLARTQPTIFDVFIGFFGGLAGILATSRKSQSITVISGVAIATALMPPLCTVGYGLATWQPRFFGGAFYLFFINSFFIALATFFMVRFLSFPQKQYMNPKRLNVVKRSMYLFAVLVMIPSVIMAVNLVRETAFHTQVTRFVNEVQQTPDFENVQLIDSKREYTNSSQVVILRVIGKPLDREQIARMQNLMRTEYGLSNARLVVKQTEGTLDITQQNKLIEDIIDKKDAIINQQDSTIVALQGQLDKLTGSSENTALLVREIYTQYPDLEHFAVSEVECYDTKSMEHSPVPVVYLGWKDNKRHPEAEKKIQEWLKIRLDVQAVELMRIDS